MIYKLNFSKTAKDGLHAYRIGLCTCRAKLRLSLAVKTDRISESLHFLTILCQVDTLVIEI